MDAKNVSGGQQVIYDNVMIAARKNIFGDAKDDSRFKIVLQRLTGAKDDLAETVGNIAATTLYNVSGAAQKAGKQIPNDILLHAGDELVSDLIVVAQDAGLLKVKDKAELEAFHKTALMAGAKLFGQAQLKQRAKPAAPPAGAPAQPAAPAPAPGAPPAQPPPPPAGIINAARQGATQ